MRQAKFEDEFADAKREQDFFRAIAFGGEKGLEYVKRYINEDPKKFMFERGQPRSIENKPNLQGLSPLHVACIHGHLEIAILLL
mmetsp:Transcript_29649/g.22030  ORF Transcript_29649/g.22030 Transcript_29649/m.22030 type:complete len:84 (-) Transcript_29649:60-311(-)